MIMQLFSVLYHINQVKHAWNTGKSVSYVLIIILRLLQYYMRTGGCKYGKACRFNHSRAKASAAPVLELNFLGLPIRLVSLLF